ncbi:MAG: hypothetical protein HGN29_15205 [Asgard group archaeon]|nr:hypothetical protein [Asgard group archaeon]
MKTYKPAERIQIYTPLHKLMGLICKENEEEIENEKYDDIILDSPTSRNQKKIIKRIPDPVERLAILALTAKRMADKEKTDDRNILFSLSRIPYFLFPNFNEETIILYSQAELEEVNELINIITKNLPQHSPRFDDRLLIILKIEYYVNTFLYFAMSMSEKRFPFGSEFYEFLSFIIHEFYTILRPRKEENPKEVKNLISVLEPYINYTTIIYFLEHYPEQTNELTYVLINIRKVDFSNNEKELLEEVLKETILINSEDKKELFSKLQL